MFLVDFVVIWGPCVCIFVKTSEIVCVLHDYFVYLK